MSALVSKHLSFCVEEMLAEVDAALTEHALVKALAQLNAREARGEAIDVICGQALRAKLEREIAQLPLLRMREKIIELQTLIAGNDDDASCEQPANASAVAQTGAVTANGELRHPDAVDAFLDEFDFFGDRDTATSVDVTSSAEVFDLRAYRTQIRTTSTELAATPVAKPKLRVRVQARTTQALALTSMALVCWISLPPLSFGPAPLRAVEIAAEQVMSLLPFAGLLMSMGGVLLG